VNRSNPSTLGVITPSGSEAVEASRASVAAISVKGLTKS
jgi:hypothetical protein